MTTNTNTTMNTTMTRTTTPRASGPGGTPAVPVPHTPRVLRPLFQPRTTPPSRAEKALNKAFVRLNIALFRRTRGKVLGSMWGVDIMLLTTLGHKSGVPRTTPVNYLWDDGRFVVCAAYGGAIVHPAWYRNLRAVPRATVELGPETLEVTARELPPGPERDALWARLVAAAGNLGRFQAMTDRLFPIVVLEPCDDGRSVAAGGLPAGDARPTMRWRRP